MRHGVTNMTDELAASKWIKQFVFLRDYVREQDEAHKEKLRQVKEDIETLKGKMLDFLKKTGGQNFSSSEGLFYKTTRWSAKIANQEEFMRHVIGTESWDLLDKKANAAAAREFAEANDGKPPPGVELSSEVDVNVNRPRAGAKTGAPSGE